MSIFSLKRDSIVILFFTLLTVVMTYPWSFQLSSTVHNSADSYLITWILAWDIHQLKEDPAELFNANVLYPHKNTLAFSEHEIENAVLAWPIVAFTNNPILAYNILTFLFFVLGGYSMYLLVYYLTRNAAAALLSGIIFGFSPYRFIHFPHLHLQAIFFFPLLILTLHILIKKQKIKYFFLFSLLLVLIGYMSGQYFLMSLVVVFLFMIFYFFIIIRKFPSRKFLIKLIISLILVGIVILPGFYPYFKLSQEDWLAVSDDWPPTLAMINFYSPTVLDYLAFSPIIRQWVGYPKSVEKVLFTGFIVVILFITSMIYIFKRYKSNKRILNNTILYFLIGSACFLLSFGALVRFSDSDSGIIGPHMLFQTIVPGFEGIRALGRYYILVLLSVSVIIGMAFSLFLKKIKKRSFSPLLYSILIIMILLEYHWIPPFQPIPLEKAKTSNSIPQVYRWLSDQEKDAVIIEFPIDAGVKKTAEYMYFSTYHWKKIVNGYSGYIPKDYWVLERNLLDFPSSDTIAVLKNIGVDYVIIHQGIPSNFTKRVNPELLSTFDELTLIEKFDDDYVYKLNSSK